MDKKMLDRWGKNLINTGFIIAVMVVFCGFIFGCYWITKTVSYELFYESMVEQTVQEMVKPEYLK